MNAGQRELREILHMMAERDLPDATDGVPCCDAYAIFGPTYCTCWEVVYEDGQAEPQRDAEPVVRPGGMCGDCAFRPGSPERRDSEKAVCDSSDLTRIVYDDGQTFACHDGLRRAIGQRHPSGMFVPHVVEDGVVAYSPPIEGQRAYKLDGSPAFHCAGLAAARKAKEWLP